jgi:hypothetical protein
MIDDHRRRAEQGVGAFAQRTVEASMPGPAGAGKRGVRRAAVCLARPGPEAAVTAGSTGAPGPAPAEPPPTYRAFLDGRVHTRVQYVGTSDLAAPLMLPEDVLRSYTIAGAVPTEQP